MDYLLSIIALIIAIVAGIPALVLAIMNHIDTKKIRREFDSSLGTPTVEIRWGSPTNSGSLPCRVTAKFNRVSSVRLKVKKEIRTIDTLSREQGEDLEFPVFTEGTKFKLNYSDPVNNEKYGREGIIRYEQVDF